MSSSDNLQNIIIKQKEALAELEKEADFILHSNLALENELLKKEVGALRDSLEEHRKKLKIASDRNAEMKNALYEQIYSEKKQIINIALKKNDVYFQGETKGELNKLARLEKDLLDKTNRLTEELKRHRVEAGHEIYEKLDALAERTVEIVAAAREKIAKETGAFSAHSADEFNKLKDEQITEEAIASIGKKNNLEAFVGGNLINKLGILFVILGIIAVSRFTFFRLPDTFKGIIMFAVSGGFLLAGELLNRKKANVFSLGVTGGGAAGLYVSLSISYFALNIISMYPAIMLCVLITTGVFVLSQRYNSQTIAVFALIGGYIPIVSISEGVVLTYGAMVYFVVLNLLALIISFYKRWKTSMFVGFFLNLAGTIYIVFNMYDILPADGVFGVGQAITIIYVLFAFAIYTVIPILSNYRGRHSFTKPDVIILGLNTFFSALIMYAVFEMFDISKYNGVMAIAFAVIYICLGRFLEKGFTSEKHTTALFYLTGLAFVVLVVPLQFGKEWLSLGWLAQGVSLAVYGIVSGEKNFKKAGFVICGLCLTAFLIFDVHFEIDGLFSYKYAAMTLGSVIVLSAMTYKRSMVKLENVYKYAVIVNLWLYSQYVVGLLDDFMYVRLKDVFYNSYFLLSAVSVTVTFFISFLLPRIPIILDKGTKIISVCLSVFGILQLMLLTLSNNIINHRAVEAGANQAVPALVMIVATIVLMALCALSVYAMYNVLMFVILEKTLSVELLPFGLSAYFLVILTQNLISQYDLSITSIAISIIYVVAALAWIIYGFMKRYAFMRRFGLMLSIMAVAKLFLIDLPVLTQGYKIVSYFAFGFTLLGISFVYQYFSRRLVPKGDDESYDEENGS